MTLRGLKWFLLSFLITVLVGIGTARAETIAATATGNPDKVVYWYGGNPTRVWSDGNAACQYLGPANYPASYGPWTTTYNAPSNISCTAEGPSRPYAGWGFGIGQISACPTGGNGELHDGSSTCSTIYSCPSTGGWSLSGSGASSVCTRPDCTADQTRDANGVCGDKCAGETGSSSAWYSFPRSTGFQTGNYCENGCTVGLSPSGAGVQYSLYYTATKVTMYGTKTKLGYSCSAGGSTPVMPEQGTATPPEPPKKPVCGATEGVLTSSSGTVACVPAGTVNAETPSVQTSKKTESFPDGSAKTTETTVTRAPSTGATETTVIQTATPAAGGGAGQAGPVGTGTASSSGSPTNTPPSGTGAGGGDKGADSGDFCMKNPGLQICKNDMATEVTLKQVKDALSPTEQADKSALEAAIANKEAENAHKGLFEEWGAKGQTNDSGWFAWALLPDAPAGGCAPFSGSFMGRQVTLDWCDEIEKIRTIAGYAFYIATAFALFSIFAGAFGGRKT